MEGLPAWVIQVAMDESPWQGHIELKLELKHVPNMNEADYKHLYTMFANMKDQATNHGWSAHMWTTPIAAVSHQLQAADAANRAVGVSGIHRHN